MDKVLSYCNLAQLSWNYHQMIQAVVQITYY